MKRHLRNILGFTAVLAGFCAPIATPDRADAAPPSYSIYCRGGQARMEHHVDRWGTVSEKQFLHSSSAYDASTLPPSTCAWPDRAFRAGEARRLAYWRKFASSRDRITVDSNMQLRLTRRRGQRIIEQPLPADLKALNRLQDPNFIVEFRVRADGIIKESRAGHERRVPTFRVTDVGVVRRIGSSNRG